MSNFTLPDRVANQLAAVTQPMQLCDASGKTVGFFVPAVDPTQYEIVGRDLSTSELAEIEKSSEWFSTDDVLRHLEKLP